MALLEQRKKMLAAEGLFDAARKQPLPYLPRIIGVVTSPTGAVIRDILHRLADRFPCHVLVWPVQGAGRDLRGRGRRGHRRLQRAARRRGPVPRPDLIIVARGGGSLEDLWGFNEEIVARAVAASAIPLISAVGHETDWTIIDLVADFRAPTPTAAAERAVPVRAELLVTVTQHGLRVDHLAPAPHRGRARIASPGSRAACRAKPISSICRASASTHASATAEARAARQCAGASHLARAQRRRGSGPISWPAPRAPAATGSIRLDRSQREGRRCACWRARGAGSTARRSCSQTLGYHNVLARGFALVRGADGAMLRRAAEVTPGAALDIEFADGHVGAHADAASARPSRAKARRRSDSKHARCRATTKQRRAFAIDRAQDHSALAFADCLRLW